MTKFKEGDIVRRKYGKTNYEVMYVRGAGNFDVRSLNTGRITKWEYMSGYQHSENTEGYTKMATQKTLYEIQVNGETQIAEKLMEKSSTNWLMQVYNTSTVLFVDKADCKEILPHTVELRINGTQQHFRYDENKLKAGEVYLTAKGDFVFVLAVDTKNKSASVNPPKLVTRLMTTSV